jgi:hypothetical protein
MRRTVLLVAATITTATTAGLAHAQTPEDRASARTLGIDAIHLADSGDCASAIPKFEAAEKLFHAPTTLERLGECQIKVGRLVAGTENLNRVARESLPPGAPAPFVAAQAAATQLLASTTPRIGKLRIHVDGAPPDRVTVTVDGVNVPSALLDSDRPTDPGDHEIAASAPGFKRAVSAVRLGDGAQQSVSLALEADTTQGQPPPIAGGAAPPPVSTAQPPPPAPAAEPRGSSPTLAFVALGVGAAGIAVGSVFGVLALGTKSTLDGACLNKSCPQSSKSDIDSLATQALLSNVGFAVGAVGAVMGVVLLVTSHHGEKREATGPHVTPWVGLGTAGLGGSFE